MNANEFDQYISSKGKWEYWQGKANITTQKLLQKHALRQLRSCSNSPQYVSDLGNSGLLAAYIKTKKKIENDGFEGRIEAYFFTVIRNCIRDEISIRAKVVLRKYCSFEHIDSEYGPAYDVICDDPAKGRFVRLEANMDEVIILIQKHSLPNAEIFINYLVTGRSAEVVAKDFDISSSGASGHILKIKKWLSEYYKLNPKS